MQARAEAMSQIVNDIAQETGLSRKAVLQEMDMERAEQRNGGQAKGQHHFFLDKLNSGLVDYNLRQSADYGWVPVQNSSVQVIDVPVFENGETKTYRVIVNNLHLNDDGTKDTAQSGDIEIADLGAREYVREDGMRQSVLERLNNALRKQQAERVAAEEQAAQEKAMTEQQEQIPPVEGRESAEAVAAQDGETGQSDAPVAESRNSEPAPKPYPVKADGTPDFEQIGTDPEMSVAAARDMGLDENVLIDNSVARIGDEIEATRKSKKMSVLEQMARVDALEKEKARWESMRQTEENAENSTESLGNPIENSNFADEGEQQNDTGGIQEQDTGVRPEQGNGQTGDGVARGGHAESDTADSGQDMVGGNSLPASAVTDQLDEQNQSIDNLLQAKGIRATPKKVVRVTAQSFHDAIAQGKVHNTMGWCVDVHDAADYENDICLLTEDGQAGIAITPDGDIISLFSNGNGKGVANKLIPMAIAMGGRKADFYATPNSADFNNGLQNLYARFGAKVVAQTPFNEQMVRNENPEWVAYEERLVQEKIAEGLSEEKAREKAHAEATDHPVGACIFPATAEEAIEFKAQNPQYTVDMDKVEKFEGENGYGDMIEHRDKELEKEKQQPKTEPKEENGTGDNEVLNLEKDKSIVILTHPIKSHYPLVRVARMSIEDGKTVYREIGSNAVLDTESGFWTPNKKKEVVKNGGVRYLVVEKAGKKRGIPVRSTVWQLAKINRQNVLKVNGKNVTGTRGLVDVRIDRRAQANEAYNKLTDIVGVLTKALVKDPITGKGITLRDILKLRPESFEVQKTDKDGKPLYDENNQPITEQKVMTVWERIQAKCDEIAQESRKASDEKYNTHSTEKQIKEQSSALQTDLSAAMSKIAGAWNRVCEKNSVDAVIKRQLENIDSKLIDTYRALRKEIYGEERVEIPTAQIPDKKLGKSGGRYTQQDSSIFRYMQVVAEIVQQAEALHEAEVETLKQKAESKRPTPEEEAVMAIPVPWDLDALAISIPWYATGKSEKERNTNKKSKDKTEEDWLADIDAIDNANDLRKKWIDIKRTALYKDPDNKAFRDRVEDAVDDKAAELGVDIDYLDDNDNASRKPKPKVRTIDDVENDLTAARLALEDAMDEDDFDSVEQLNKRIAELNAEKESIINSQAEMQRGGGVARAVTPVQRFVTNVVMKALGKVKGIRVHRATQEDVARVLERIKNGQSNAEMMALNDRFNEKLGTLSEENADSQVFDLGSPSPVLLAAGVQNKPLKLYGNKIIKKAKEHGYSITELRNLPEAVANPIAVFNNYQQDGSRSILTELKTADGNFLVTLTIGKGGVDIDFNIISSVFGKAESSVVNWIEKGYATYLNKEKTLEYLHFPAPIAAAANTQELNDVAKVVQNFENPKFEQQENTNEPIETFEHPDGTVYGWAVGNEIYLTEEGMNSETPIHEYTHLWAKAMENVDPKGWAKIVRLCKANKALWESVKNDPNYANIKDDESRIASEVLSRYAGKHGMERLTEEAERMAKEGKSFESDVESKLFVSRIKNALNNLWSWVKNKLGIENLDDISDRSLYDLLNGTDLGLEELGLTTEEKHIAEKAKADGTYMQAPNGKPSNLSPKQWLQTRTEAFKKWFGDWEDGSQNKGMLLDENGEPKVVYRGSANDDFVFRSRYGEGTYWFTDNREVSEHYARRGADHELTDYELDGRVQPVFLRLGDSSTYNAEGRNWENVYTEPVYQIIDEESGAITAEFKTREEAERYCEENGLDPEIEIYESNGVTGDIAEQQFADGKTGVVFENIVDGGSLATDVVAHILQDTYDAIEKAEQNKVKRAMYDLLRENPEVTRALRLPVPQEVYYVKDEAGEWVRKSDGPTKEERAEARSIMTQVRILEAEIAKTSDEAAKNALYDEIDALLEAMPFADEYTTKNVWQSEQEKRSESVGVWVDGVLTEMRFPNMEQVANALNNKLNTQWSIAAARQVNGFIAGTCTQYNPAFFAVNFVCDVPFILAKGSAEYGYEFAARFGQEIVRPTNLYAIGQYLSGGFGVDMREIIDIAPKMNEFSELWTRFSAYRAMPDCGYSQAEALKAAKNLSVNFNRRGFGYAIGNLLSSVSMFANATIQGASGFYRTFGGDTAGKGNSKGRRVARAITNFVAIPAIAGALFTLFTPDDDDKEKKIPDWERDNYICIGNWRIPLNEQIKPFFLVGVNAVLLAQGRRTWGQVVSSMAKSITLNLLPVPPTVSQSINLGIESVDGTRDDVRWETRVRELWMPQGLQNFNALAEGKDFMGRDLRADIGDIPEYRAAPNEAQMYQDLAYIGYVMGGGRKDMYSTYKKNGDEIDYNRNPKEIKNNIFFTLAPQGWVDIMQTMWGIGHAVATKDSVKESVRTKDIPIVNRFYKPTSVEMYRYGILKQTKEELQMYKDRLSNASGKPKEPMLRRK